MTVTQSCMEHQRRHFDIDEAAVCSQVLHRFVIQCKEAGKCVVFSSHIMSEAEKLCDRMAIIHNGQVLASGTLEELRAESGMHYLEDIFLNVVKETVSDVR